MRITVHDIDWDVAQGTPWAAIAAATGVPLAPAFVGDVALDRHHPAGMWPLGHGALVTTIPGEPPVTLPGPHLAVVAGPDAGQVRSLSSTVSVGRASRCTLPLDDPALAGSHAAFSPTGVVTGRLTSNGLRRRGGGWLLRGRWRPGQSWIAGSTVIAVAPSVTAAPSLTVAPAPAEGDAPLGRVRAPSLVGAGSGIVGAVTIGVVTGRWWLAALIGGLGLAASVAVRLQGRRAPEPGPSTPFGRHLPWECAWQGPVAVVGESEAVRGFVRALVLARGRAAEEPQWREPWQRWLAPALADDRVVTAARREDVPSWCTTVAVTSAHRLTVTRDGVTSHYQPLGVSARVADAAARRWAHAHRGSDVPKLVRWADLPTLETPHRRRLVAHLGVGMDGPVSVDLDEDGPHLLVAGTTGSGKSATLETLLLSLAHSWGPHDLTLALMDFKGGAGLGALAALPHVRSLLTDLDGGLAERALVALAAELDERKRALASAGFESFSAWERATGAPPRLVVVADEYQEISAAYRDFVPHIARLAAQGRSLGLHLVLSTQRPAGAVTPDIRANISTVIALRVTSEAESRDVIGTPEAARIPAAAPGRAILARGTHHVTVQVAQPVANPTPPVLRAGACDSPSPLVEAVQARWAEASPAPALWAPPLPDEFRMEPRSSPADACVVALADVPEQRRTEQVLWQPRRGPLVAVGPSGSGRTALLAALTEQCSQQGWSPVALPPDARLAERTLELAAGIDKVMIIADDVTAGDPRAPLLAGTLPFAAVIAGDATLPLRSAAQAAVTIIMAGLRDALAWGVPREYAAVSGPPGRSMVVAGSRWRIAQAARGDEVKAEALVQPLPQHISRERADCWPANVIGLGGDRCDQVVLEPCRVAVIGPAGSERDAAIAWLESRGHACSAAEHGAGIKGAAPDAFLVLHPTRAGIRSLAPAVPEGLIDTAPHPGRVALIQGRSATPLQLPQGAVQPPQLPDLRPPRAPRDPATAAHRSAQR